MRSYPLSFVLGGYFRLDNSKLYNQKAYGNYWSTTVYSDANGYNLETSGSSVNPTDYSRKLHDWGIRCV